MEDVEELRNEEDSDHEFILSLRMAFREQKCFDKCHIELVNRTLAAWSIEVEN